MTIRVYRYELRVGRPRGIELTGDPLHVAATQLTLADHVVEFWAEHDDARPARVRTFQAFGTGRPLPVGASYWGTTPPGPAGFVWHLYELPTATTRGEST